MHFEAGVFWVRRDFVFFFVFVLFERTRPAASMRPPCLIYLSTIIIVGVRVDTFSTTARIVEGYRIFSCNACNGIALLRGISFEK